MNIFEQYDERLRTLETILDADEPVKLRQAHITSTSPLAVKYSGETASHPIQYAITSNYGVGDHVVVAIQSGAAYLLGTLNTTPVDEGYWYDFEITDTNNFANSSSVPLQYRRLAGRVELVGEMSCTTAGHISGTTSRIIGTIPPSFRPTRDTGVVVQANGSNRVYLRVLANGEVALSRFGPASNGAGAWIGVSAQWSYK